MYADPISLKLVREIVKLLYKSGVNRYEALAALSSATNTLFAMDGTALVSGIPSPDESDGAL